MKSVSVTPLLFLGIVHHYFLLNCFWIQDLSFNLLLKWKEMKDFLNPKKGGLQKSLKRVGGNNAHPLYMVFGTLEWGLGPPKLNLGYLEDTWGLFHVPPDP